MKALILAAGMGTRLKPLTDKIPKALVPIGGKPLLQYHFVQLEQAGIKEVLINTHYLSEQVQSFFESYPRERIAISLTHELELLGSAGTLLSNKNFFKDSEDILIIYSDVLTDLKYQDLITHHRQNKNEFTVVCYEVENVHEKGMVIIDDKDRILRFHEKPAREEIVSNFVNAGIYVLNKKILDKLADIYKSEVSKKKVIDFGKDVFPFMIQNNMPIAAYRLKDFLIDVGTPATYELANKKINQLHL